MRSMLALAAALGWLLLAPTRSSAQDAPGDWTVIGAPPAAARGVLRPSLWLVRGEGPGVLVDVLGEHAVAYPASTPRTVVMLQGQFDGPDQVSALDWERATLTPQGRDPLAIEAGEVWDGQGAGPEVTPPMPDGVLAHYRLRFPALDPACGDVTLSVPARDAPPLVVRFRRWRELIAEAEADLAAWKQHIDASRMISAIRPYLEHPAYRRLVARGAPLLPALLLRELARGEAGDRAAVPRFLVLHVLATTEWGRRLGLPGHGDEQDAARVLQRWREQGSPRVPGIAPPEPR